MVKGPKADSRRTSRLGSLISSVKNAGRNATARTLRSIPSFTRNSTNPTSGPTPVLNSNASASRRTPSGLSPSLQSKHDRFTSLHSTSGVSTSGRPASKRSTSRRSTSRRSTPRQSTSGRLTFQRSGSARTDSVRADSALSHSERLRVTEIIDRNEYITPKDTERSKHMSTDAMNSASTGEKPIVRGVISSSFSTVTEQEVKKLRNSGRSSSSTGIRDTDNVKRRRSFSSSGGGRFIKTNRDTVDVNRHTSSSSSQGSRFVKAKPMDKTNTMPLDKSVESSSKTGSKQVPLVMKKTFRITNSKPTSNTAANSYRDEGTSEHVQSGLRHLEKPYSNDANSNYVASFGNRRRANKGSFPPDENVTAVLPIHLALNGSNVRIRVFCTGDALKKILGGSRRCCLCNRTFIPGFDGCISISNSTSVTFLL